MFEDNYIVVTKRKVYKQSNGSLYRMTLLEETIIVAVRNLKRIGRLEEIRLSDSHKNAGVDISQIEEGELRKYVSNLTRLACFHGVGPAKDNWHQINGLTRPIVNAAIIELGKILPYLPGIDKNDLYRAIGIKIGQNTTIAPRVQFDYFHPELIEIGDNCLIGDNVKIWTHDYGIDFFAIGKVKIGNSVFIGSESVIGPATTLGDNVRVNLGAHVYGKNIPADAVVKSRLVSDCAT